MIRQILAISLFICIIAAGISLFAKDIVHLRNGNKIEGEVIEDRGREIVLKLAGGTITINKKDISRIEREKKVVDDSFELLPVDPDKTLDPITPDKPPVVEIEPVLTIVKKESTPKGEIKEYLYTVDNWNFRFQTPPGWTIEEYEKPWVFSPQDKNLQMEITISVTDNPPMSFEAHTKLIEDVCADSMQSFHKELSSVDLEADESKKYKLHASFSLNGTKNKLLLTIIRTESKTYTVVCFSSVTTFSLAQQAFAQTESSINLEKIGDDKEQNQDK
ncbi:MAG: hypothetical protein ABIH42_08100 [Planctomycetota bacterium]